MRFALTVVVALAACRSPSPGARPQPPAAGGGAVDLAAFVPADTPIAIFVERKLLDHPFGDIMTNPKLDELRGKLRAAAAQPRPTPGDRFWGKIAETIAPMDVAMLRSVGWWPGKSEAVLYSVGLVPVLRAHVDGDKVRALLDAAFAAAGLAPRQETWHGAPYLSFVPEPGGPQILIAHRADQLVVAVTADPPGILDHLTRFEPPSGSSLAQTWTIDPDADHFLYLEPARMGALLAEPAALARVVGVTEELPGPACLGAIGQAIAALPRTTSAIAVDDRTFRMDLVFDLAADTAALFRGTALPGWPDDGKQKVPTLRLGLGAAPYPLLVHAVGLFGRMDEAGAICRDEGATSSAAQMLDALAPLQMVHGLTWEMAVVERNEVTMTVALAVRDVPAMWALLAKSVPLLGTTVPAIGEVRDLPMVSGAKLGVGRERVVGALGSGAGGRVRAYLNAGPGPRAPMLGRIDYALMLGFREGSFTFLGEPMRDENPEDDAAFLGDMAIESRIDGSQLILDFTLTKVD